MAPPPKPEMAKAKKTRAGKLRRTLGWTLLTLGLIVAGAWVWSGWYIARHGGTGWELFVSKGVLTLNVDRERNKPSFSLWSYRSPEGPGMRWRVAPGEFYPYRGRHTWDGILVLWEDVNPLKGVTMSSGQIVLWPIPLLLWFTAAPILRSGIIARRRATTNTCTTCGYNLTGLGPNTPCPECGKTTPTCLAPRSGSTK